MVATIGPTGIEAEPIELGANAHHQGVDLPQQRPGGGPSCDDFRFDGSSREEEKLCREGHRWHRLEV